MVTSPAPRFRVPDDLVEVDGGIPRRYVAAGGSTRRRHGDEYQEEKENER